LCPKPRNYIFKLQWKAAETVTNGLKSERPKNLCGGQYESLITALTLAAAMEASFVPNEPFWTLRLMSY
jgi:hypothetical protein